MAIMAKVSGNGDGKVFEPAPEGVHQAVLVDVVDLGILQVSWQGVTRSQHKVNLAWQINENREDGKPFLVFKRYTLSLHEKSGLRKDLESWRGRKITRGEEQVGVDLEGMIGQNCLLNVTHNQVGDRVYANVSSVNPLMKGMPKIVVRDFVRKVERTPEQQAQQAEHYDERNPPPPTDEDLDASVPFAWLMPLVLPALGLMGMFA